jgi:diaminohydroxyphosphoribosylaminopyrimidine deaminase/5-amino-6-(5-phosphoribosylamino)uracil reductase
VVVGVLDPDRRVAGRGVEELRASGVEVVTNVRTDVIEAQLAPYLKHRRTGLPYVVLKLASTLDGRTAAPDGTSQWITGPAARLDAHRLRADSGAIVVGRGTFEADRPRLNVRLPGPELPAVAPRRVVVTSRPLAADGWLVVGGSWQSILAELGRLDVLQVLVEGGATLSCGLHMSGLVDRYVVYQAPILMGGDDGLALLKGKGAPTLGEAFVGRLAEVRRVGRDLRIDLVA